MHQCIPDSHHRLPARSDLPCQCRNRLTCLKPLGHCDDLGFTQARRSAQFQKTCRNATVENLVERHLRCAANCMIGKEKMVAGQAFLAAQRS